jgi:hypothetical protein
MMVKKTAKRPEMFIETPETWTWEYTWVEKNMAMLDIMKAHTATVQGLSLAVLRLRRDSSILYICLP